MAGDVRYQARADFRIKTVGTSDSNVQVQQVVMLVRSVTFMKLFLMYFLLCIPLFFHATCSVLELRKRRRKVRRCFSCGHIGVMEPYLQQNKPFCLTFVLLCAGIIPGLYYLRKVKKRYTCSSCGRTAGHVPVSEALAHE